MPDTYWLLDRGSNGDDIPIDYVPGDEPLPTPNRGDAAPLRCAFVDDLVDYTTLSEPALTGKQTRYDAAEAYVEYASCVKLIEANDGQAYFVERVPSESPVSTFFLEVTPPSSVETEPFYGVVTGGSVESNGISPRLRLDLQLAYLGDVADYASRSDARSALEA